MLEMVGNPETIAAFAGAFGNLADVYQHKHMVPSLWNSTQKD
jgi:hypothetical protein